MYSFCLNCLLKTFYFWCIILIYNNEYEDVLFMNGTKYKII